MGKGKSININSEDCFYAGRRPSIQKGFYKLFIVKHKVAPEKLVECLEEYRIKNQTISRQWSKEFTLDCCSANFEDFRRLCHQDTNKRVDLIR